MANTRNRKKSARPQPARPYGHTLIWTVLFALVFSAGLIAGQRAMQSDKHMPLVALGSSQAHKATATKPSAETKKPKEIKKIDFSFHDRLSPKQKKTSTPARYTLQLGSFPELGKAKRELKRLRGKGLEVHMVSVRLKSGSKTHRVRLGKFHSMDEARQFQDEMTRREKTLKMTLMPL